VWFVSDHGCKFPGDAHSELDMMDKNRTNISLFLWEKEILQEIKTDLRLCSIIDLYPTIHRQLGLILPEGELAGLDLEGNFLHDSIWIDDYSKLQVSDYEIPDIYGKRSADGITVYFEDHLWHKSDNEKTWQLINEEREKLISEMLQMFAFFSSARLISRRRNAIRAYESQSAKKSSGHLIARVVNKLFLRSLRRFTLAMIYTHRARMVRRSHELTD